jgi:hypothetical protein
VEFPDGRIIDPDDPVTLKDLCELLPFLMEAMQLQGRVSQALAPGQSVPVAGGLNTGRGVRVTSPSQFGPSSGVSGGGGVSYPVSAGGFVGSGGGGAPGPQGQKGPPGATGATGPAGPGSNVSFKGKTDGDFSAGPGAFVPVPATKLDFVTAEDGPALFLVQATLGGGAATTSQNGYLGLRIDGVDHPLAPRSIHTMAGGVDEYLVGNTTVFPIALTKGSHSVEVILRGLALAEFVGGLGVAVTVSANPGIPLVVTALHR